MGVKAEDIVAAWETLKAQRSVLDFLYKTLLFHCLPQDEDIHSRNVQDSEKEVPEDSTGIRSNARLASGLFANTFSLEEDSWYLQTNDPELKDDRTAKDYYQGLTATTLRMLQSSNFKSETLATLPLLPCLGTTIVQPRWNKETNGPRFKSYRISESVIAEDDNGNVDTFGWEFYYTSKQAYQRWPNKVPRELREEALSPGTMNNKHKFIYYVAPRMDVMDMDENDVRKENPLNMPWMSVFVHVDSTTLLEESGYKSFPFAVTRFFKQDGKPYGRSAAMNALPDMRQLNRASVLFDDAAAMQSKPPLLYPVTENVEDIKIIPGAVIPFDPTLGGIPTPLQTGINLQSMQWKIERSERNVQNAFFTDLFDLLEQSKEMTATEVDERVQHRIEAISPVAANLDEEYYGKIIPRVAQLIVDNGAHPKPPPQIANSGFVLVYTNRLQARLRDMSTSRILRSINQSANIEQATQQFPDLKNQYDVDAIHQQIAENNVLDPKLIRTPKDITERRQAQLAASAEERQREMALGKIGPIDPAKAAEPGSLLDDARGLQNAL